MTKYGCHYVIELQYEQRNACFAILPQSVYHDIGYISTVKAREPAFLFSVFPRQLKSEMKILYTDSSDRI
jgi:hypothetical protein